MAFLSLNVGDRVKEDMAMVATVDSAFSGLPWKNRSTPPTTALAPRNPPPVSNLSLFALTYACICAEAGSGGGAAAATMPRSRGCDDLGARAKATRAAFRTACMVVLKKAIAMMPELYESSLTSLLVGF